MRNFFFIVLPLIFFSVIAILTACNSNEGPAPMSKEDSLKVKVERGNYLVHSVVNCVDCHSQLDPTKFSLPVVPGTEGGGGIPIHEVVLDEIPGKIFIPNITPFALKDWTDEEIANAMTKGINKKGDTLFPMMPYHGLSRMAKEDVESVIAYLRTLKPIENSFPARQIFIPAAMFGPLPDGDYKMNTRPDSSDKLKYGEYLLTIAHCTDCHTPFTPQNTPDMSMYLAGGHHFKTKGFEVTVANITPDSATGIGTWTEDMFLAKFRTNSSPEMLNTNPGKQNTIMPWSFYGTMKDGDLKAIYAYLRTVKPVEHKIVKWAE